MFWTIDEPPIPTSLPLLHHDDVTNNLLYSLLRYFMLRYVKSQEYSRMHLAACVVAGTIASFLIGRFSEYYMSTETSPVSLLTQVITK